jgi:hypothetical protein
LSEIEAMRIGGFWNVSIILACLTCSGCGGNPASPPAGPSSETATTRVSERVDPDPSPSTEPPESRKERIVPADAAAEETPPEPDPTGLAGKWLMSIALLWPDISQLWIVEITTDADSFEAKEVDSAIRAKVKFREMKQVEDRITFEMAIDDQIWRFDGLMVGGRVQGCIDLQDRVSLAWLERTRLRSLSGTQASVTTAGIADFTAAQRSDEPKRVVHDMLEFADRYPTSPLGFDALRTVVKSAKAAELSDEQLRRVAARYEEISKPWGTRWHQNTVENIAYDLATAEGPSAPGIDTVALEYAESAKSALPENATRARRQSVQLAYAVALVNNNQAEAGKKILDSLMTDSSVEGEVRYRSALAAEKLGDLDGAIESLLALWPHPLAKRELERIWKDKHGELSGLEDRLDEVYLKRFPPLATTPYAGREDPASNQVALVELFTGTGCPPCVAADVAFESLGGAFKTSDVVLLQYHLHVPSPDPLTNPDSEARASYYLATGTPFIFFNGKETVRSGGPRQKGPDLFVEYRGAVEAQLKKQSQAKIELSAKRDDNQLAIDVKLSGVEPNENLRLRLAVVEDTVRFTGLNGVRLHRSVVRAMPGGPAGVAIADADLTHRATVNIGELRESLAGYLADHEKQVSQENNITFEFPAKPLDLNHLAVAAFLQNDETRDVVQAAFVRLSP